MRGQPDTVDVWRAKLVAEPDRLDHLSSSLDSSEHSRATRFHFEGDRTRFIVAHAIVRRILATYLGVSADSLRFDTEAHGKPFLAESPGLRFNLSHSGELLVLGVARDRSLGIDIERVPRDEVVRSVAGLVFSAPERRLLERSEKGERRELFARFWTRKEAYIKADGRGMSFPLRQVDVSAPDGRVQLLDPDSDTWSPCSRWTLRSVPVAAGYDACVAAEGDGWNLACFDWTDPS